MRLYHYTCLDHGDPGIQRDGFLRPNYHPLIRARLLWLTEMEQPHELGLGLTSHSLSCERWRVRYEVNTSHAERYLRWVQRRQLPRGVRDDLEHYGMPRSWWIATTAIPVVDRVVMAEVSA
jgi:hypothetical protein